MMNQTTVILERINQRDEIPGHELRDLMRDDGYLYSMTSFYGQMARMESEGLVRRERREFSEHGMNFRAAFYSITDAGRNYLRGSDPMNWEQKFAAINAVAGFQKAILLMREPGNWYVSLSGLDKRHREHMLCGISGNGKTPEEAVHACWADMTDGTVLTRDAMKESRKCFRWNGFMWEEVGE